MSVAVIIDASASARVPNTFTATPSGVATRAGYAATRCPSTFVKISDGIVPRVSAVHSDTEFCSTRRPACDTDDWICVARRRLRAERSLSESMIFPRRSTAANSMRKWAGRESNRNSSGLITWPLTSVNAAANCARSGSVRRESNSGTTRRA